MGGLQKRVADEVVYLNPKDFKLFNLLKKSSTRVSDWKTLDDISKKSRMPVKEVRKRIRLLGKNQGIPISTTTENVDEKKTVRFGLPPEVLGIPVKQQRGKETNGNDHGPVYSALYLGEPAFGTKAYDPRSMAGLALALEVNNLSEDIDNVIIQGAVVPHIPPHWSKSYRDDSNFLAKAPRGGRPKDAAELALEEKIETEFERAFYEKHINDDEMKKITNLTAAFRNSEEQLMPLMDSLPEDATLTIQLGEEDRKNIDHIQLAYVMELAKEKSDMIAATQKEIKTTVLSSAEEYCAIHVQRDVLQFALDKSLIRRKDQKKRELVSDFMEREENIADIEGESIDLASNYWGPDNSEMLEKRLSKKKKLSESAIKSAMKYVFQAGSDGRTAKAKIRQRIKELNGELEAFSSDKRDLVARLTELDKTATWTDQLLHSKRKSITWFTKQYPIDPAEVELTFKKAKDAYTRSFYGWRIPQSTLIHVSPSKHIILETKSPGGIITSPEGQVDYSISAGGGKKVMLVHNIRHIFSDNVSNSSIKEAKLAMNYQNMVLKKFYQDEIKGIQPDVVLLGAHNLGGFRAQPWFKESEHIQEDGGITSRDLSYLINLPTFQSIPRLEWLANKGFSNWHVKRYVKGPYASGATLHTVSNEGVNSFTVIDNALLTEFGDRAAEIEAYRESLKEKGLSATDKKQIRALIKEKKAEVKFKLKTIEAAGDHHLGSPDQPYKTSKFQMIEASQSYQMRHGLPDVVCYDESLHGCLTFFGSGSRYLAMTPPEFKRKVINPILASDMSGEDKAMEIAKMSLMNHRGITVHNEADQKQMFGESLMPYLGRVMKKGGQVILASGNHYNGGNKQSDEALELANQFTMGQRDSGQVIALSGRGSQVGAGTVVLPGGQKLFYMHKFPERQDEIYGMMMHLRKANNDADIVLCGDRHQPGVGYADGHAVVLHPGYEPINKYVPLIGKPAGVHGFVNVGYDPDKKGVYKFDMVLDPTLEKVIEAEKIL